ncbi:hypothetical protein GCM10011529_11520 [Polymorphobacter glacialis]|uniref:Transposase DDE domain-containing protein n=1 Tax=Sandarakinorhabdus glacialis TaxID=1614636 RepID=A0A916ZPL2_9SPHN|nr:hypothetical protein GCM10011529_11520 [Polymorphobacter glacialis]
MNRERFPTSRQSYPCWKNGFNKALYKGRNAIERSICRLKDCRRLATRYDKLAANFLGNIYLAAAFMWWP